MLNQLEVWLADNSYTKDDIRVSDDGRLYVMSETDNGNPGEDGFGVNTKRIYLDTLGFDVTNNN